MNPTECDDVDSIQIALEELRLAVEAKNLTCHLYNQHSELYWLFKKTGQFEYEYQLYGPLTHPTQAQRFQVAGEPKFRRKGIEIDFFEHPPLPLNENVLGAQSFYHREKIALPIRVRLLAASKNLQDACIFINFNRMPSKSFEAIAEMIFERMSGLQALFKQKVKGPRIDGTTGWLLRSIEMKLRNQLGKIWLLGSVDDIQKTQTELFNGIAKSVFELLVRPNKPGAKNLFCTLATVNTDNQIDVVGEYPRDSKWPFPESEKSGIINYVAHTGQLFFVPNVSKYREVCKEKEDPLLPEYLEYYPNAECELAVPLIVEGRVVGVINIEADTANAYDIGHVVMLFQFASTVALILRLLTLFKDLNCATSLQQNLLASETQEEVLNKVLEAFQVLGYKFPRVWDCSSRKWIMLPGDKAENNPRADGFTYWVEKNKKPLALADIRKDASFKIHVGDLEIDTGYFRKWDKPNSEFPVIKISPDLIKYVEGTNTVMTDIAFPIFSNDNDSEKNVSAVLWAKCKRNFCTLLPDECWFLSIFCQSASVALKVLRERSAREKPTRLGLLRFHFGESRAIQINQLLGKNNNILDAKMVDDVIILNIDIRGSTKLAASLHKNKAPQIYADMIRKYQELIRKCVIKHGGVFDKTMGDGVQALFNVYRSSIINGIYSSDATPAKSIQEEGQNAIKCVADIFKDISRFSNEWTNQIAAKSAQIPPEFAIGAGLSSGPVYVGSFFCLDEIRGYEYSAHGEAANVAAKLQGAARADVRRKELREKSNDGLCGPWTRDSEGCLNRITISDRARLEERLQEPHVNILLMDYNLYDRIYPLKGWNVNAIPFGDGDVVAMGLLDNQT